MLHALKERNIFAITAKKQLKNQVIERVMIKTINERNIPTLFNDQEYDTRILIDSYKNNFY